MTSAPIFSPVIPFLGPIGGHMQPGRMVRIQGSVPRHSKRFDINLVCGPSNGDDIALHISVRMAENCVVRNTLQNLKWGPEERNGHKPFHNGQGFEVLILCDPAHYKISVNGQHFADYPHRIPYQSVTHLQITNDVLINIIKFEGGFDNLTYGSTPGEIISANPVIPFLGLIGGNMHPGRMVRIQGSVPRHSKRFDINLVCGPSNESDIALHISVRMAENCVVRNTLQNLTWGPEERNGQMPFHSGQAFEVLILCDPAHYKICVNGKHFADYPHRIPYQRVTHLQITNDVLINMIKFEGGFN